MSESPNNNYSPQKLQTQFTWRHLLLNASEFRKVRKIENWINLQGTNSKKNHLVLFHGVPGTGKTLTASLLGKHTGRDVYRIDLSTVVSKFIGETEKNLAALFDKLKNTDAILFFDEADALFGKRTEVRDAHDKFANQEVSYLLQRIENHPGLAIFSTKSLNNVDKALKRKFETLIEFKRISFLQRNILTLKIYSESKSFRNPKT